MPMEFERDNAWPAGLLGLFESWATHDTFEDRYVGVYNTLLQYCFGLEHPNACIAPGNPYPDDRPSTHPIVYYVAYDVGPSDPILLVEIKDDSCADLSALRRLADEQMRELYEEMLAKCPLPRLWGLSLLGRSMRVYCGDVKSHTVDPPFKSGRTMPPSYLAGEWDLDILSQEGFEKMKTIIGDIMAHRRT